MEGTYHEAPCECERLKAELAAAREEITALQKRVRGFAADAAKLRALCAARPKQKDYVLRENWTAAMDGWCVGIDAAGRGEGER